MFSLVWIMPPKVMTRSAVRPIAKSQGGGTGVRVGRGGRGRRPREGNDERVDYLNGKGNDQGMGVNEGVERVNGNVEGANGGAPEFLTIIAQQLQNLLLVMLARVGNQGNVGNQNGGAVVLTQWIKKMESVHDMSGCSVDQKVKYTAGSFVGKALTWWNSQICTLSQEVVSRIIERYVYGLAPQIRKMVAVIEPKTIQKVVHISDAMTDEAVRNRSIKKVKKKGNLGEPSKDKCKTHMKIR
nr:reverse transcriptase domain-containing protein [Tanacetum cinerariifolium]